MDAAVDSGKCTTHQDCDDGLTCTTDTCKEGACSHALQPNACLIGKQCYASGAAHPASPCHLCDPSHSTTSFKAVFCVSTLAGDGTSGYANGPAVKAAFKSPWGLARHASGKVYVADGFNHVIRMVDSGLVSTHAGTPQAAGHVNGPAAKAQFSYPTDVVVDAAGVVYVADYGNHVVRVIKKGQVTTLAGDGKPGFADGTLLKARFNFPTGLALGSAGEVFVADTGNHRVRVIKKGQVTTLAGDGTTGLVNGVAAKARFHTPKAVAQGSGGVLYVADHGNHCVRVIKQGNVDTLAGDGKAGQVDGPAASARFKYPHAVAVDSAGVVYVADRGNHSIRTITAGTVGTLAGSGAAGFADGPALKAKFNAPTDVFVVGPNHLLVADRVNSRLRIASSPIPLP